MTFEKWGERIEKGTVLWDIDKMYTDWKAEREQVEIALLATRQQRDDEFNRAEKLRAEQEKLIGAAQALIDYVHNKYPGEELRCPYMKALEAALVEVKEKI